jgi:ATP-dependent Clp protease, protease subunit
MGRSISASAHKEQNSSRNNSEESVYIQSVQAGDSSRLVVLHGDVNEASISLVVAQLLHLAGQNHKPIHLVISTYGGSVDEMFTLYDTIKFLPCPVHTIALGKVMSAGVLLLASGTKGKRMIGRNARIMIHPVSGGASGNVFEVINDSKEHKRLQEQMVSAIVKETKVSKEKIEEIMKTGHDVYLLPEEAIKMGIVDKIIGDK